MATTRISRSERKARTREELLAAARTVFLRRGFHGASLEEIADEAGYTKGAVYSNFADKDALFLAVLETHYAERVDVYRHLILEEAEDIDTAYLMVSRFMAAADEREPGWLPLLGEFVVHAARQERVRREYLRVREGFLESIATVIAALLERHGVALRVTPLDAARASSLLLRAVSGERLVDPQLVSPDLLVELHTALLRGLTIKAGEDG